MSCDVAEDGNNPNVRSDGLLPYVRSTNEGLPAKRVYIAFLADFHFLQDQANFWQTDLC